MAKSVKLNEYTKPVFDYLKTLSKGEITTYKKIAQRFRIANARNVGWILQQNTKPNSIPCYKVIRSDGSLANGYKFGGKKVQKKRLIKDRILFKKSGKIMI
jgi:methylated-DNA-protein-cysteine methyltransferase-like protein